MRDTLSDTTARSSGLQAIRPDVFSVGPQISGGERPKGFARGPARGRWGCSNRRVYRYNPGQGLHVRWMAGGHASEVSAATWEVSVTVLSSAVCLSLSLVGNSGDNRSVGLRCQALRDSRAGPNGKSDPTAPRSSTWQHRYGRGSVCKAGGSRCRTPPASSGHGSPCDVDKELRRRIMTPMLPSNHE